MNFFSIIGFIFSLIPWLVLAAIILIIIFWKKTIFPEKIRQWKEKKKMMAQIQHQAEIKAMQELEPQLIEAYKKKQVEKMSQTTADKIKKFSDNLGIKVNPDKMNEAFGGRPKTEQIWRPVDDYPSEYDNQEYREDRNRYPRIHATYQQQNDYRKPRYSKSRNESHQRYQQPQPRPFINPVERVLGSDYSEKMKQQEKKMKDLLR